MENHLLMIRATSPKLILFYSDRNFYSSSTFCSMEFLFDGIFYLGPSHLPDGCRFPPKFLFSDSSFRHLGGKSRAKRGLGAMAGSTIFGCCEDLAITCSCIIESKPAFKRLSPIRARGGEPNGFLEKLAIDALGSVI